MPGTCSNYSLVVINYVFNVQRSFRKVSGKLQFNFSRSATSLLKKKFFVDPLGFIIDTKNYLKESLRNELVKLYRE